MISRPRLIDKRVRLIRCFDACVQNPPGLEGFVTTGDDLGTVHVRRDNGSTLGLVPGVDRWEEI